MNALELVTAPATNPVTTDEVLRYLNLADADETVLVSQVLIGSAVRQFEEATGRVLISSVYDWYPDRLSGAVALPLCPVVSVDDTEFKTTSDDASPLGDVVPSSDYELDTTSEPAVLRPLYGLSWPNHIAHPKFTKIRFTVGYASSAVVPADMKVTLLEILKEEYWRTVGDDSRDRKRNWKIEAGLARAGFTGVY
jgi:uncharacterized phiE125 gp8 family phage protein